MSDERKWSSYQEAIFEDVRAGAGHLAVNARAGSGKTTTVLEALRFVPPGLSTLFCAFNKAIAEELAQRAPRGVEVSTLHSYGLKAVTRALGRLKIESRLADDLARGLVGDARETWELRSALVKCLSLAKATLVTKPEEIDALIDAYGVEVPPEVPPLLSDDEAPAVEADRERFVRGVRVLLEWSKDVSDGRIDFDDMIWLPVVLNLAVVKYDRVFVDETQDLNACQIKLVLGSIKKGGRICAVGDPKQAIYGFRGASSGAFERVVGALDARVLPLSVTYRCARSIVKVANEIVPDLEAAPGAIDGVVRDDTFESCARAAAPGDFILSRTNAPLVGLCLRMLREGRRAHIQGRDIGAGLKAFVKKSGAFTVDALRRHATQWRDAEVKRLTEKGRSTDAVEDKTLTILALSDGAASVDDVVSRIERLFADGDDRNRVTLSTTHKAKGLERDRVWMLADTYRKRPGAEEENLTYVAITRARKELVMVYGSSKNPSPEIE